MKKRNLLIAAAIAVSMGIVPACDIIESCGTCVLITEDADGNVISEGTPLPFCGEDLTEKQNDPPVTVGGVTTYWDCY
jgi:hypothetical protein